MDIINSFKLTNRIAIVTGGAGLLGQEFCKTLASAGAKVILADVDRKAGNAISAKLREQSLEVDFYPLDIADPDSSIALLSHIGQKYGRLDVLVNSAAIDPKFDPKHIGKHIYSFEDYPLDSWSEALKVNLTGMFLVTQATARMMVVAGKGSIINICSTYGLVGPDQRIYPGEGQEKRFKPVSYSVTKAALLGFTRYLASYYAGSEIRVNALTPGGVFKDHDEEFVKAYSARTILGRMAEVDEMNGALLFLASDASSYVTGANIIVDGGWTAW